MQEVTAFFRSVANYITRKLIYFTGMEPFHEGSVFFLCVPAAVQWEG